MKTFSFAILVSLSLLTFQPHLARAENEPYQLLAPIPLEGANSGVTDKVTNINTYIPGVIKLTIAIAGGLAVLMIIVGGMQYISSATIGGKTSGRETIKNALIGLMLAIGAWVILHTLNPDLVKFDLNLAPIKQQPAAETSTSPTNPANPDGPATSSSLNSCTNCAPIPVTIPAKQPPYGCQAPGPCVINATLASKLQDLAFKLRDQNINWQVTEMYPPTVPHISACHNDGTCVDATVADTSFQNLANFFMALDSTVGTNYEYEACGSRLKDLQSAFILGKWASKFKCETTTTGESVHINL